jgi:hypothetical protein
LGKGFGIGNQLIQWGFLKDRDAQNLQKRVEGNLQGKPLFNDCGKNIDRNGNPDLCFHGVLGSPEKRLDSKILLDPAEEQLNLPAELVKLSDGRSRKSEVIRQKDQIATVVAVIKANPAKPLRKAFLGIESGQGDDLIGSYIRSSIHRAGNKTITSEVGLGPDDEECLALMKGKESAVIHVAAVEDIKTTGFEDELVQNPHIVCFSIRNMDKRRNRTPQIKKRVKLNSAFLLAEHGPREKRQAQIDRGRIKGIDGVVQIEAEILVDIKRTSLGDEDPGKISIDSPVASFIGMSQGIAGNLPAKSHVIKPAFHSPEAGLDIAKTFAIGQLGEGQTEELIVTRKAFDLVVSTIPANTFSKLVKWEKIHNLGKNGRRGIHQSLLVGKGDDNTKMRSNRLRPKSPISYV